MEANITGSLFIAYRICRLRAWYDLHGDRSKSAPEPPRLQQLLRAGVEHERKICDELYPDAAILSGQPNEESHRKTVDLMEAGTPVILQGVLKDHRMTGVPDVLERVRDVNGRYRYRAGDIKYSETVRSSHVLQLAFYDDLLGRLGYSEGYDAFIIDRHRRRNEVDFSLYSDLYKKTLAELQDLLTRTAADRPPIRLSGHCRDCKWRQICMPEVDRIKHISLLPMLSERSISDLCGEGIDRITSLPAAISRKYPREIEIITSGSFLIQDEFKPGIFNTGIPATVNVTPDDPHVVTDIVICRNGSLQSFDVTARSGIDELKQLDVRRLFLYGRDYDSARRLCDKEGIDIPLIDIFSIVNRYVHAPFVSLELESVANFVVEHSVGPDNEAVECGSERLNDLLIVLNWLDQLECVSGPT